MLNNTELSPIALFVYNRPWHTEQTLEALSKNINAQESILYVFADGPKASATEEDLDLIKKVKSLLYKKKWCKEIILVENSQNIGLASNITKGVSYTLSKHGKVIVLEDDIVTSPYFLNYCNTNLDLYKDEKHVYSINGFQFPLNIPDDDTFLCPLATSSWGWATWEDRWKAYEPDIEYKNLIQTSALLKQRFNIAEYDYATMLNNNNSWAIKWYYSVFIRNGLGLFPTKSLVYNIGFDGSGTHDSAIISQKLYAKELPSKKPERINLKYYNILLEYFSDSKKRSFLLRVNTFFKKCLNS